ncbi:hypothetical protein SEA_ERENYEAGER_111 [Microbacterium phage Erenyeager]|nr:hypothetical protein SEA_ERENYEAGER_111 [Microbacterium phage Erenyeager]
MSAAEYPITDPTEPGRYESRRYPVREGGAEGYVITEDGQLLYDGGESVFWRDYDWREVIYRLGPFRKLEPVTPKSHTTTVVKTRETWAMQDRIVRITSGTKAVGLAVLDDPTPYPADYKGMTTLTADQAEEIANDLLARVAEIRASGN